MAEYHVNNIEDFITEVSNSSRTVDDTVILDNNIDAQNYNFNTKIKIYCNIDGNGKTIYNIQSEVQNLFEFQRILLTIKNLIFKNIVSLPDRFFSHSTSPLRNKTTFENCQFQGTLGTFAGDSMLFHKCFFDIKPRGNYVDFQAFSNTDMSIFNQCYIIIHYKGGTTGSIFPTLIDCYLSGEYELTSNSGLVSSTGKSTRCVFNAFVNGYSLNLNSAAYPNQSIFNSSRLTNATITNGISCSDSEMKNAQTLKDKGFDIIV